MLDEGVQLKESQVSRIIYEVLSLLSYMRSQGIVHRHIRPANILVKSLNEEGSQWQVHVTGFEYAIRPERCKKLTEICGAPGFIAPEVYDQRYNHACDIWSLGITVYELLTFEWPVYTDNDAEYEKLYKNWEFDTFDENLKGITPAAKTFLSNMLLNDSK